MKRCSWRLGSIEVSSDQNLTRYIISVKGQCHQIFVLTFGDFLAVHSQCYFFPYSLTLPKNILNLRIKIESVTVGADGTVYVWFLCQICCLCTGCAHKPDVFRGSHVQFYAEIQTIFGEQCIGLIASEIGNIRMA